MHALRKKQSQRSLVTTSALQTALGLVSAISIEVRINRDGNADKSVEHGRRSLCECIYGSFLDPNLWDYYATATIILGKQALL